MLLSEKKKRNSFFRFLGYVKPYKGYVALAVLGGIVKFTVPLFVPDVTRRMIDHVFLNSTLSTEAKVHELVWNFGGLILVFVFLWAPLTYVRHFYASKAGQRSVFDLRRDLYDRVLRMSAGFFHRHKSGGILSRLMNDVLLAQDLVGNALTNVWMDMTSLAVILFFLFRIDVSLTLVALASFPFYLYFFRKLGDKLKDSTRVVQQEIETMSGKIQEKVSGVAVVRSFTREEHEGRQYLQESDRLFTSVMRTNFLNSLNITVTGVLTSLAPLVVMLYGGWQVVHGNVSVGGLIAVGMYLGPLYLPLQRFSELNTIFSGSMAALDRIFEIMDENPDVIDRPGAVDKEDCIGELEFRNVSFGYGNDRKILSDVSFHVSPGEKVALVGHSGSGKTTVTSLIPRFYDPDDGLVLVDGKDVREWRQKSLRRHMAIVLQDPILFSGTVRENLLYGNPAATNAEIEAACVHANSLDFIRNLPRGFETEVGERGAQLSGGQKQRLTIARAFLRNPKFLILDEATSNLDSESERLIKEALDLLMVDRTTVIIAHRLSTVRHADQILVLDQGRIVETGRHEELIATQGIYRKLYSRQTG